MEDVSVRLLKQKLPKHWVLREYDRDYGIDFAVELFDYVDEQHMLAETLGEHLLLQLKSVSKTRIETERVFSRYNVAKGPLEQDKSDFLDIEVIKFVIDTNELYTIETMGHGVPVLLVLATLDSERLFFVCMNDLIDKVLLPEDPNYTEKKTKVINIPVRNEIDSDPVTQIPLRFYAKRPKVYAALHLFEYQRNELSFTDLPQTAATLLTHFDRVLQRLDIWDDSERWGWGMAGLMGQRLESWRSSFRVLGATPDVIASGRHIWEQLVALGHLYEETCREWFLPTLLAQHLSYIDRPTGKNTQF